MPEPIALQDAPSHRAMWLIGTVPLSRKAPPASNSPLGRAMRTSTLLFRPGPSVDQDVPSQRRTLVAAVSNHPPTTTSPLGRAASADTDPLSGAANTDQFVPSQREMVPVRVPLLLSLLLAINSPLGRTASRPALGKPAPKACHDIPSQRATPLAETPPAMEKRPPATRSPPGRTHKALTDPFVPVPRPDHCPAAGSHAAILLTDSVSTLGKSPPMTNSGDLGPGPSGSHMTLALTLPSAPGRPSPGSHRPWQS